MTNEQLKILLESQAILLEKAIEKSAELMPDNAEREEQINMFHLKQLGRYVALVPLHEHLDLLRLHIEQL